MSIATRHKLTQEEALQLVHETYEDHEISQEEYLPDEIHWRKTPCGWLPLFIHGDQVWIVWNVVIEHGRRYVRYVQEHLDLKPLPPEERARRLDEKVKLVGGNFPW